MMMKECVEDEPHSDRPSISTNKQYVAQIRILVLIVRLLTMRITDLVPETCVK